MAREESTFFRPVDETLIRQALTPADRLTKLRERVRQKFGSEANILEQNGANQEHPLINSRNWSQREIRYYSTARN